MVFHITCCVWYNFNYLPWAYKVRRKVRSKGFNEGLVGRYDTEQRIGLIRSVVTDCSYLIQYLPTLTDNTKGIVALHK